MAWQSPDTDSQGPVLPSHLQDWLQWKCPPCTSGNNWPLIYKTFRSILFWWWKLSSFSATNIICYLYSSCEHYGTLLKQEDSSICITRNGGKQAKYWKINWHAQSYWQLQRILNIRHPVHCALDIQASPRITRYIGDSTLIIQKERKKAMGRKT